MSEENKKLFEEFQSISGEEWKQKIIQDLKGKDYEATVIWKTLEGFDVEPYYRREDLKFHAPVEPSLPGDSANNDWHIRQDIIAFPENENDEEDNTERIKAANNHALAALMKGATALGFDLGKHEATYDDLKLLLNDIQLEHVSIHFSSERPLTVFSSFLNEVKSRKIDPGSLAGSITFNPFFHSGPDHLLSDSYEEFDNAKELLLQINQHLPGFKVLQIDTSNFHVSGASITQEIAIALAQGNECLAQLTDSGVEAESIPGRMQFNFHIGSGFFMEIAKLRAFRMLWSKVVQEYQNPDEQLKAALINCSTSTNNLAAKDPYNNLLRATTEAMSAVIGGCDSLSIIPFNSSFEKPNEFSERLSRNIQLILKHESYLDKVIDPAAGSYYIEQLTEKIAERSWHFFQQIEAKGGYLKAIEEGFIQAEVKKVDEKKKQLFKEGKIVLTGVNKYQNSSDQ